jgi:hypothetical protein
MPKLITLLLVVLTFVIVFPTQNAAAMGLVLLAGIVSEKIFRERT